MAVEVAAPGGPISGNAEKAKLLSSKDSSAPPRSSKGSPHVSGPEPNTSPAGRPLEPPPGLLSSKDMGSSPPSHQRAPKKEQDQQADLPQPEAPRASEDAEGKASKGPSGSNKPPPASDPLPPVSRERRQKGKKGTKERHPSKLLAGPGLLSGGTEDKAELECVPPAPEPCSAVAAEKAAESSVLPPRTPRAPPFHAELAPSKRTVKVTLTPLKMEGESQPRNVLRGGEAEAVPQNSKPAPPVGQDGPSGTSAGPSQSLPGQDSSLILQEGAKAQEDGAYKRRYPRRSARARSNMFFGLTPLYGVRSYGEEDIPFFSSAPGRKRAKRAAEGQVDGADDASTSEEEDLYYYSFARTVVSATEEHLAPHRLFREEEQCGLPKISQLDGVDDGSESDTSITVTTRKVNPVTKRGGKENGTESLKLDRSEEGGEKAHATKISAGHKSAEPKAENCRVKAQSQDSLEAQLSSLEAGRRPRASPPSDKNLLDTFSTELLKSDSDNNNSDDCGNILPSDIMDFVLKNTPSMQALGESPESSSSELLTLGEGLGLDGNRGKDMGLFEVFSQQLPTAEPVDSSVSSSISAEEQFELPLELPSDLSVLTTRSPAVPSQNHSRLAVISEPSLSSSGERSMLALSAAEPTEKRVAVPEKPASSEGETALLSPRVEPSPEGHMPPDPFAQGHVDADHIASPPCGQVEQSHGTSQDLTRNSGTPALQVPASPTLPLQNAKYGPGAAESPGPSQISNAAVQTAPHPLKAAAEKLLVVNQNMQPLYVLQTLPNGVTQKIQLTSSVSSAPGVMEASPSVLGPMGSGLALAAGLSPSLPSSQPLFPPASKGLLPMPHHQHLHSFSAAPQSGFPPALGSSASGLLIGVQQPPEPESTQRADTGPAAATPASGLVKKRPIARLQSRKNKKLAPSTVPSSDMVSNMTLINFTSSQLPSPSSLLDLGTAGSPAPHRTLPNIIKRSKSGVMYFEQASLLPQSVGTAAAAGVGAGPHVAGPEAGHLATGPASGLSSTPSVLNVVSMQTSAVPPTGTSAPGHVLGRGSVALSSPGPPGVPDLGPLGSLLIRASQQGLGLPEQHAGGPSSGSGMFPPLGTASAMTAASGLCVLPSAPPPLGVTTDPEGSYQPVMPGLGSKAGSAPSKGGLAPAPNTPLTSFPPRGEASYTAAPEQSKPSPPVARSQAASPRDSPPADQPAPGCSMSGSLKARLKVKRLQPSSDSRASGKKHKTSHPWATSPEKQLPHRGAPAAVQDASCVG